VPILDVISAQSRSDELVSATALGQPHVYKDPATGTLLVPRPLPRFLDLGSFFAIGSKANRARFVGLLDRTLRMDAAARIG
jgi:hypothetical protein